MARAWDLSYTIVVLKAISSNATNALGFSYNKKRLISAAVTSGVARGSRSKTPPVVVQEASLRLSLRDSEKPFDPQRGFTFGSDTDNDEIDILLHDQPGGAGVSRLHFAINFNWDDKTLLIKNFSRNGTILEHAGGETTLQRYRSAPLLSGSFIRAGYVLLQVVLPERGVEHAVAFSRHLEDYRRECEAALPRVEDVALADSTHVTVTESEQLKLVKSVGKGVFAEVFQAISMSGGYFAVKVFNRPKASALETVKREATLLSQVDHEHVLRVFTGKTVDVPAPYLVMEYIELGTVEEYESMTLPQLDAMFRQTCDAVAFLHQMGITHRDLKPANILLKSIFPVHIVIGDFGLASQQTMLTMCGSLRYMAPEVFFSFEKKPYSSKADVWSVGVMLLEFAATDDPADVPEPWQITKWLPLLEVWKQSTAMSGREHLIGLARQMLVEDPGERPNMEYMVNALRSYTKSVIRQWVKRDSNRKLKEAVCLTELLDYLCIDSNTLNRILAKVLRGQDAYKLEKLRRRGRGRRRDVYVSFEQTLEILSAQVPSMFNLMKETLDEERCT